MTGVFVRREPSGHRHPGGKPREDRAEMGVMQPQAKDRPRLPATPEAGRGRKAPPPGPSQGLQTPEFSLLASRTLRQYILVVFKPHNGCEFVSTSPGKEHTL